VLPASRGCRARRADPALMRQGRNAVGISPRLRVHIRPTKPISLLLAFSTDSGADPCSRATSNAVQSAGLGVGSYPGSSAPPSYGSLTVSQGTKRN
jgi:hypothetical protein